MSKYSITRQQNTALEGPRDIFSDRKSLLNMLYELDIDKSTERCCFRSEVAGDSVYDPQFDMEPYYYGDDMCINDGLCNMMKDIRRTVNNTEFNEGDGRKFKSYSKYLAAPLFKYTKDNPVLVIAMLPINTMSIDIEVTGLSWVDSMDIYGEFHDRSFVEPVEADIPLLKLCSDDYLRDVLHGELLTLHSDIVSENKEGDKYLMADIDDIRMIVKGFTVDISGMNRSSLDKYYGSQGQIKIKRVASYKTDQEVISTKTDAVVKSLKSPKLLQVVRFLYLLRITGRSDQFDAVFADICDNWHEDIFGEVSSENKSALEWISEYLKGDTISKEYENYMIMFGEYWSFVIEGGSSNARLSRLLDNQLEKGCFDKDILDWLKAEAGVIDEAE